MNLVILVITYASVLVWDSRNAYDFRKSSQSGFLRKNII
jgi:hypothetical protein